MEVKKSTDGQVNKEYNIDTTLLRLKTRINELENDLMRHQDKDRDYAYTLTTQAYEWFVGTKERLDKLEQKLAGDYKVISAREYNNISIEFESVGNRIGRLEKLEALHKTEKPAEFPESDPIKEKDKILYKFAGHLNKENKHTDIAWVDYFIEWLDKNGYEIREKKNGN